MKIENMLGNLRRRIRTYLEEQRRISAEYKQLYSSCFEGSPQEVERKLEAWDYVHRITRR